MCVCVCKHTCEHTPAGAADTGVGRLKEGAPPPPPPPPLPGSVDKRDANREVRSAKGMRSSTLDPPAPGALLTYVCVCVCVNTCVCVCECV